MEEEEESETEALAEDDPEEGEEGVPRRDESESGKGTGHAKEAGDRKFNEPEWNEPTKEELEATETPPAVTEITIYLKVYNWFINTNASQSLKQRKWPKMIQLW